MTLVNAYGARWEADVMQDTWGHLAPEPGRVYAGTFVVAHGCYDDLAVISAEFADLPDSPWFHEHLHDWISDQATEPGKVYRFTGTYSRDRGDRFIGKLTAVAVAELPTAPNPRQGEP